MPVRCCGLANVVPKRPILPELYQIRRLRVREKMLGKDRWSFRVKRMHT